MSDPTATAAGVFAAPNVPAVLRRAADDLESRPWLKPANALRLWADALEMEARNGDTTAFDRVNAALKELWAVAEEAGLTVLSNDDKADDGTPQIVLTLEGQWPDGK